MLNLFSGMNPVVLTGAIALPFLMTYWQYRKRHNKRMAIENLMLSAAFGMLSLLPRVAITDTWELVLNPLYPANYALVIFGGMILIPQVMTYAMEHLAVAIGRAIGRAIGNGIVKGVQSYLKTPPTNKDK